MRKLFVISFLLVACSTMAQRTPTMGWSSWNTFALNINENLIRQQADAMHRSGLQQAGYQYVNIDDGYWDGRAEDGHLRLNRKLFPNGMRSLVDYIHSLGLKAGIYSDAGDNTCGSEGRHAWGLGVGLAGHEKEDCQLYFIDWDFDFIKVDYCGGNHMGLDEQEQYTKISNAIKNCGAKFIGAVETDGYTFDDSEAVIDGKFIGLPLDDINEDDKTDTRIEAWIAAISPELA